MKVTIEVLKQFNACKEGIDFLQNNYPDGAEAMQIMQDGKAPIEMLHFAYQYFPVNHEEIQLYRSICEIDQDSKFCWYSNKIKNSRIITNSINVSDSKYVGYSHEIYESTEVLQSYAIRKSRDIYNAHNIRNSQLILSSDNITESIEIQNCSNVTWSRYIVNSTAIDDSAYIYNSSNISDCYCSGFLNNCHHCLFCSNLQNSDYYIFNEKVSPEIYNHWKELLLEQLNAENNHMIGTNIHKHLSTDRYIISNRFDCVFDGLSENFYGWVGTVTGVTDLKFLNLFFRDR